MWQLIRPMLPVVLILAVPIVPFLLFGEQLEGQVRAWQETPPPRHWIAAGVVALLASDLFLPVPSSLVCTLAGWQLGAVGGTLVTWLGMNLGAILGFALARQWGQSFALLFSRASELQRAEYLSARYGPPLLAVMRGIPVLAEASVLWMGMHGLAWRAFLLPVVLSNLVLAAMYCSLGEYAHRYQWLPMALAASVAVPVALAALAQRWLARKG
jgi:uncharacterized membrane protein YdjX (TVP38/TMEM64 family)